jgi:ribosomal protein L22
MSDETPELEVPEEEPKKPRRRRKKAAAADAPEATSTSEATASSASEADVSPEAESADDADEADAGAAVAAEASEPPAEEEQESEAVAEDEADAAEKPKPARRRRRATEPAAEEPPAKPAPRRRRSQRDPNLPPPVVRAQAKYVRSSPRKARLVCDHIRGKSVEDARAILAHTPRAIARDWSKLLESAVANAEHNHELVGEDLYVKAVHADDGPTIKRFRPRAMGRATKIRKRTSHLTILLTPKE